MVDFHQKMQSNSKRVILRIMHDLHNDNNFCYCLWCLFCPILRSDDPIILDLWPSQSQIVCPWHSNKHQYKTFFINFDLSYLILGFNVSFLLKSETVKPCKLKICSLAIIVLVETVRQNHLLINTKKQYVDSASYKVKPRSTSSSLHFMTYSWVIVCLYSLE